ncbi:MAG TPA: outer membrane lipoprotein-sorting protein, partial [Steroidobacteraceae bacterium]|nr:outer membrane lipoprotein-sorting protein [Steroidobacteraceae bacterium]
MFERLLLALAIAPLGGLAADNARDVMSGADRVRNPDRPFRVTATVVEYKSGKPVDKNVYTVFSKVDPATGQFRDVMIYAAPPRDAGKMLLLNGANLWFYDPGSRQSVRISPQQKLTGEASAGDVLTENLAVDYAAAILDTQEIEDASRQKRICWHLELKAAGDAATYNRVEYWVEQGSYFPVKAKFYADSGALLKVLYYRDFAKRGDRVSPAQAVIIDAVDSSLVTVVDVGDLHFQDIPDSWFQRDYLPHLKA